MNRDQLELPLWSASRPPRRRRSHDQEVPAILSAVAGDLVHERDAEYVRRSIVAVACRQPVFSANDVRPRLFTAEGELRVHPKVVGAMYAALVKTHQIARVDGKRVRSTDRRGNHCGHLIPVYRAGPALDCTAAAA